MWLRCLDRGSLKSPRLPGLALPTAADQSPRAEFPSFSPPHLQQLATATFEVYKGSEKTSMETVFRDPALPGASLRAEQNPQAARRSSVCGEVLRTAPDGRCSSFPSDVSFGSDGNGTFCGVSVAPGVQRRPRPSAHPPRHLAVASSAAGCSLAGKKGGSCCPAERHSAEGLGTRLCRAAFSVECIPEDETGVWFEEAVPPQCSAPKTASVGGRSKEGRLSKGPIQKPLFAPAARLRHCASQGSLYERRVIEGEGFESRDLQVSASSQNLSSSKAGKAPAASKTALHQQLMEVYRQQELLQRREQRNNETRLRPALRRDRSFSSLPNVASTSSLPRPCKTAVFFGRASAPSPCTFGALPERQKVEQLRREARRCNCCKDCEASRATNSGFFESRCVAAPPQGPQPPRRTFQECMEMHFPQPFYPSSDPHSADSVPSNPAAGASLAPRNVSSDCRSVASSGRHQQKRAPWQSRCCASCPGPSSERRGDIVACGIASKTEKSNGEDAEAERAFAGSPTIGILASIWSDARFQAQSRTANLDVLGESEREAVFRLLRRAVETSSCTGLERRVMLALLRRLDEPPSSTPPPNQTRNDKTDDNVPFAGTPKNAPSLKLHRHPKEHFQEEQFAEAAPSTANLAAEPLAADDEIGSEKHKFNSTDNKALIKKNKNSKHSSQDAALGAEPGSGVEKRSLREEEKREKEEEEEKEEEGGGLDDADPSRATTVSDVAGALSETATSSNSLSVTDEEKSSETRPASMPKHPLRSADPRILASSTKHAEEAGIRAKQRSWSAARLFWLRPPAETDLSGFSHCLCRHPAQQPTVCAFRPCSSCESASAFWKVAGQCLCAEARTHWAIIENLKNPRRQRSQRRKEGDCREARRSKSGGRRRVEGRNSQMANGADGDDENNGDEGNGTDEAAVALACVDAPREEETQDMRSQIASAPSPCNPMSNPFFLETNSKSWIPDASASAEAPLEDSLTKPVDPPPHHHNNNHNHHNNHNHNNHNPKSITTNRSLQVLNGSRESNLSDSSGQFKERTACGLALSSQPSTHVVGSLGRKIAALAAAPLQQLEVASRMTQLQKQGAGIFRSRREACHIRGSERRTHELKGADLRSTGTAKVKDDEKEDVASSWLESRLAAEFSSDGTSILAQEGSNCTSPLTQNTLSEKGKLRHNQSGKSRSPCQMQRPLPSLQSVSRRQTEEEMKNDLFFQVLVHVDATEDSSASLQKMQRRRNIRVPPLALGFLRPSSP